MNSYLIKDTVVLYVKKIVYGKSYYNNRIDKNNFSIVPVNVYV